MKDELLDLNEPSALPCASSKNHQEGPEGKRLSKPPQLRRLRLRLLRRGQVDVIASLGVPVNQVGGARNDRTL
ncbi:MAG: hypothetical protein JWR22_2833 [Herminiimonas sp.]|nr:hypothetical protein [Herminiimonas sp.]